MKKALKALWPRGVRSSAGLGIAAVLLLTATLLVWEWRRRPRAMALEVEWLRRAVAVLAALVILLGTMCSLLGLRLVLYMQETEARLVRMEGLKSGDATPAK